MDSLIDTFHIDWKLIIAQMVNFGIVIIVLYKFAIKPLGKLMEERSAKIAGGLTDAKKHKELLADTEAEYKKVIAEARKESQELIAVAKKDAETVRAELVNKAQADAKKIVADGKTELEAEKAKMLADAKRELASLVVASTEKVLGNVVDADLKSKIASNAAKEI
jgi:F-type H+-transporting ATPase subunit b